MTSRRRVSWTSRLLPVVAPLLVLPFLGAPALADPSDPGDPGDPADPPAASSPREIAEQALETVEEIIEGAPELTGGAVDGTLKAEGKSLTLALRDLAVTQSDLPRAERATAERLLARPADPNTVCMDPETGDLVCYGSRTDRVRCNSAACVHWIDDGPDAVDPENDGPGGRFPGTDPRTPDYVELTLATMSTVVNRFAGAGYRKPVRDGAKGGSSAFDIYLGELADDGAYGYCTVDDYPDDSTVHVPAAGYCVLDNDYAEFGISPRSALRVTAAHEYFHAVQFAYDVNEDAWLMEATATWAEDELYDSINDNWNYLPYGSLGRPQQPLDVFNDLSQYGNWIFFRFLGERYTGTQAGMPTIVRDIWRRTPGEYSVEALKNVLASRGTSVPAQLAWFTAWNRRPASYYQEGAAYRPSPTRGSYVLSGSRPKKVVDMRLNHLASSTYRFTRPATGGQWRIQLKLNLNSRTKGGAAVVSVKVKGYSPTTKVVALDAGGDGTYSYPFRTNVEWVDVTPVNASTRYSGCDDPDRDATSTCQGFATDDAERQVISALAYAG